MILEEKIEWQLVMFRPLSEEEQEEYNSDVIADCQLPDDGDEILVQLNNGMVFADVFCVDGSDIYSEYVDDWRDVYAWAAMPKGIIEEE